MCFDRFLFKSITKHFCTNIKGSIWGNWVLGNWIRLLKLNPIRRKHILTCCLVTSTASWWASWWTPGAAPCEAADITACGSSSPLEPAPPPRASPVAWSSPRNWPRLLRWWRGRGSPAASSPSGPPACSSSGELAVYGQKLPSSGFETSLNSFS